MIRKRGDNAGREVNLDWETFDAATSLIPREIKEFLVDRDPGSYDPTTIVACLRQWGVEMTIFCMRYDLNGRTLQTYGPTHPNYDPHILQKDPRLRRR